MTDHALTTNSIKDLLIFPFRGKDWHSRFLIGMGIMLLGFIPFLPWLVVSGYVGRIMKRAMDGEELELPAWEDWGKLLTDGLRLHFVSWIYLLPGYMVIFGGMAAYFVGFFLFVPLMAAAEQNSDAAIAAPLLMFALMGVMFFSMFLGYFLLFLGSIPLPIALARVVEHEKFKAGFQIREIRALLWRNKGNYFVAWLILIGLFAIFYIVSMMFYMTMIFFWLIFILGIPAAFYLMTIAAALFGQTYRDSLAISSQSIEPA